MFRRRKKSDPEAAADADVSAETSEETQTMSDNADPNDAPETPTPLKPLSQRPTPGPSRPSGVVARPQEGPTRRDEIPRRGADKAKPAKAGDRVLTVGPEIFLSGQISACDRLVVEGGVEAELTDAKRIEVSAGGSFKGSAMVEEADISGTFDGDLTGRTLVTVRTGGRVNGNVTYGRIVIEDGGVVIGELKTLV